MTTAKIAISRYLAEHNLSQTQFAFMCKLAIESINRYLHGHEIHPRSAQKIEDATKGKIRFEELTDLPRPKNYRRRKGSQEKSIE